MLLLSGRGTSVDADADPAEREKAEDVAAERVGSVLSLVHMVETLATCLTTVRGRPFSSGFQDSALVLFAAMGLLGVPAVRS